MKARVLIADDHEGIRDWVVKLIGKEFEVVGAVADGRQVIDSIKGLRPDVVILDLAMPRMTGIEAAREICRGHTPPKILFLSDYADSALVEAAFECGAVGYITKPRAAEELIPALRAAAKTLSRTSK